MAGMDDYAFSVRMRDTIASMVESTVNKIRPADRYGVVDSIDLVNQKCGVILTGETAPVLVSMGAIKPTLVGDKVRVSGRAGDHYVADVFDGASFDVVRLTSTGDVTLASTDHALQIGLSAAANLAIDANEIQARNNGAAATLYLNALGGVVQVGGTGADVLTVGDPAAGNLAINGNQIRGRTAAAETGHLYLNFASASTTPRVYIGRNGNLSVGDSGSIGGGGSDQVNTGTGYLRLNWETSNPVAIGPATGANTLIRPGLDVTGAITATGNISGVTFLASGETWGSQARIGNQSGLNTVLTGNHLYARNVTAGSALNLNTGIGSVDMGANGTTTTTHGNLFCFPNHPTTGSAVNCHFTSAGYFYRFTSARKYKEDIRDLEIDVEAALQLRPRQFHRNDMSEVLDFTDSETGEVHHELGWIPIEEDSPWYTGFIAEEAEDLGFGQWVEYGDDGEVEGFQYQLWVAAQQAIIRSQQERIVQLEDTMASLAARLDALEAA